MMPWDPMRDLRVQHERLERLAAPHPDSWTPPIDVYETDDGYVIAAEVPGLARGVLTVTFPKATPPPARRIEVR